MSETASNIVFIIAIVVAVKAICSFIKYFKRRVKSESILEAKRFEKILLAYLIIIFICSITCIITSNVFCYE